MSSPTDPSRPRSGGALVDHLAGLAEDVRPADLRDRVYAASHRVTVRRRAVVVAAAVTGVLVIAAGVALAGRSAPDHNPLPADTSTPATKTTTQPATNWTDQIYLDYNNGYRELKDAAGKSMTIGEDPTCGLTVSPDRTRMAWVRADGSGPAAELVVSGPHQENPVVVLEKAVCTGGNAPYWLPDSGHLLITPGDTSARVVVDVATKAVQDTPLATVQDYVAWSPNGQFIAYEDGGKIVVAKPDGTEVRRIAHGEETPTGGFSVQGVSDDGRRAVVGSRNSDPSQVRVGFRLVDTVTGANVSLPAGIQPADKYRAELHPAAGNHLIARIDTGGAFKLYLLDANLKVLDRRTEPRALQNAIMLSR